MLGTRFRRRQRWRPPAWFRFGAPVVVAGIFVLSKYAGLGVAPYGVAVAVYLIVGTLMWVNRPAEPGEFR
jgi:hypothetical protein